MEQGRLCWLMVLVQVGTVGLCAVTAVLPTEYSDGTGHHVLAQMVSLCISSGLSLSLCPLKRPPVFNHGASVLMTLSNPNHWSEASSLKLP